jgi:hypothetical protein
MVITLGRTMTRWAACLGFRVWVRAFTGFDIVVPLLIVSPHSHSLFFFFKQTSKVKEFFFFSSVKLKEEKLKGVFVLSSRELSTYYHQVLLPLISTYNFLNSIDVGVGAFSSTSCSVEPTLVFMILWRLMKKWHHQWWKNIWTISNSRKLSKRR